MSRGRGDGHRHVIGYGVDTWCMGRLVTGRLARRGQIVIQAIYNRIITPPGTLRGGDEERAFGFGIENYIGAVGYEAALLSLPAALEAELSKEDRAKGYVVITSRVDNPDGTTAIDLQVAGVFVDEDADFTLTMRVSDTSVELLGGIS